MARCTYPLFKVQRPLAGSGGGENMWLFYTERHRDDGFQLHVNQVPTRIKRAMGFSHKVYLYLDVTYIPTCDCEEKGGFDTVAELERHCKHAPLMDVKYVGAEGSRKKTNW